MTNTTKVTVITTIAVLAVIGVVALFASPSADRDRAWVEQFPAFTQLPEDDWELLDDNVTSDYFLIRLSGWSETTAQREAIYVVDRDVDPIAAHIDEQLGIQATHTRAEQYGVSWTSTRGSVSGAATYQARESDHDRNRAVSVDVRPDPSTDRTRVTLKAGVSKR